MNGRNRTATFVIIAALAGFIAGGIVGGWGMSRTLARFLNEPLLTHYIARALEHWSTVDDLNRGRVDKALWSLNLSLDADISTIDNLVKAHPDSANAATGIRVLKLIAAQRADHPSVRSDLYIQSILKKYPKEKPTDPKLKTAP